MSHPPAARRRTVDESPERWQKALERAEGLTLYQCAETGAWYATSGTEAGTIYPVNFAECQCPAGVAGDRVCRHRAKLRERFGLLAAPKPALPPAQFPVLYMPAALTRIVRTDPDDTVTPLGRTCGTCRGEGAVRCRDGSEARCVACDGDGWVPDPPAAPLALAA